MTDNVLTDQVIDRLALQIARLTIENTVQAVQIQQLMIELKAANADDEENKEKGDGK